MPSTNHSLRHALLSGAALVLISVVGAGVAQAGPLMALDDTVHVTGETLTSNATATINFANLPGGKTSLSVYTAPELLSGTFGGANIPFSNLLAYCTDLYDYAIAPATYTVGLLTSSHQPYSTPLLSASQVNEIANLIHNTNHTDQAATQLAIWSVEYGTAFSFSKASDTTAADEASYMQTLDPTTPRGFALYQLQDQGVQGFAIVEPVPEPASMALLGVGMIATSFMVRRRRQSTTTPTA